MQNDVSKTCGFSFPKGGRRSFWMRAGVVDELWKLSILKAY